VGCGGVEGGLGMGAVGEVCLTGVGRGAIVAGKLPHCFVHRI